MNWLFLYYDWRKNFSDYVFWLLAPKAKLFGVVIHKLSFFILLYYIGIIPPIFCKYLERLADISNLMSYLRELRVFNLK